MRTLAKLGSLTLGVALVLGAASCGGDDKKDKSPGGSGTGGESSSGTGGKSSSGTGGESSTGTGGESSTGTGGETSGTGGTGGETTSGTGGSAGAPAEWEAPYANSDCSADDGAPNSKVTGSESGAFAEEDDWIDGWTNFDTENSGFDLTPEEDTVPFPDTGDRDLTADNVYLLSEKVWVADGETLTIEAGTIIQAGAEGSLIVSRGGRIEAEGTASDPIIFTSNEPEGDKDRNQWGGVIILGKASNFKGTDTLIEGLDDEERNYHGGNDDEDDSGIFTYVRIEFGGTEISPGNEINGLTMGSVGSGTEIHHIEVNTTQDDCYEWFGGTVSAHHLVCNNAGDDMFDCDQGLRANLSELLGIVVEPTSSDPNGFEMDSDLGGAEPVTTLDVSHATLCGAGQDLDPFSYGMVLRENLVATMDDTVVSGFDAGFDIRDDSEIEISNSQFFDMVEEPVAYDETDSCDGEPECDDDNGLDEVDLFESGDNNNHD